MNVVIVYGTKRKGSTYTIARSLVKSWSNAEVKEIVLPDDMPEFCISCFKCFTHETASCAHDKYILPIRETLRWADVIILTSPVYSFHVTGQMKVFLDHFANMWIVHRPEEKMFKKVGAVIATAAGPVYAKTLGEMKDSLDFWGVSKTYKLGFALMNTEWDNVDEKIKHKIDKSVQRTAVRIQKKVSRIHKKCRAQPCARVRLWFAISRMMQKIIKLNPVDADYWAKKGWTKNVKPWK